MELPDSGHLDSVSWGFVTLSPALGLATVLVV